MQQIKIKAPGAICMKINEKCTMLRTQKQRRSREPRRIWFPWRNFTVAFVVCYIDHPLYTSSLWRRSGAILFFKVSVRFRRPCRHAIGMENCASPRAWNLYVQSKHTCEMNRVPQLSNAMVARGETISRTSEYNWFVFESFKFIPKQN